MVHYFFSTGLEFTFDRNKQTFPGSSFPCGVLLCQQNNHSSSDDNLHNITIMTLLKTSPSMVNTSGNNKSRQRKTLATVSADQPELEHVFDRMKVHGLLKDGWASLRVELFKQSDCQAKFTCQVGGVDFQGKEIVTSSRLLQPHDQSDIKPRDMGMAPVFIAQMLSLIQGLDAKYTSMEKGMERLEDKLNYVDDKLCKLDSELSAIDSKAIQDKVLNSMNDKIQEYFSEVMHVSERTDDTLERTVTFLKSLDLENYRGLFQNAERDLRNFVTQNNELTEKIENSLISFKDDIDFSWKRLETSINKRRLQSFQSHPSHDL